MKLSKEQIQELYAFTRQHYVEHYDLQTELVDHMANGIEKLWVQYPNMSFEDAKQIEFKKFGIFGFMEVVEKRQKVLSKRYGKLILRFYKEYFRLPKILLFLALTSLVYVILDQIPTSLQVVCVAVTIGFLLIPMLFYTIKRRRILKKRDKKWMFEEMLLNHTNTLNMLFLPLHFFNFNAELSSVMGLLCTSFFIVSFYVVAYIILLVIPAKAEELLAETYPEYKFAL